MLQGQTYTVMLPFTATGRAQIMVGSPNVKDLKSTLHANIALAGIDLASLGLRDKRLDLSPREIRYSV